MSNDQATKPSAKKATLLRAVLYARVSSDDRGKDGRNLKSQLDMCREYALKQGYSIIAELAEDDRGASGASFELPQLSNVLAMAERGEYDVLVVRELDRLSRNLAKQLIVEEELRYYTVLIEYVLADYDDTPEGHLQKHIRATVAEYEREKIKERCLRGKRNAVRNGKVLLYNEPPYGYRLSEDGELVVHEPEAEIIRLIFQWYTEGDENGERLSAVKIARKLTEMNVLTWTDARTQNKIKKRRGSGEWAQATIGQFLRNEMYIGKWHYGQWSNGKMNPREQWIEVQVPAIIDENTWLAAREQACKNTTTARRNVAHNYLMRYRVACNCGYSMQCKVCYRGKDHVYLYYHCPSMEFDMVKGKCNTPHFRVDQVDAAIWEWLKGWLQNPGELERKLQIYKTERERANAPILAFLNTNENLLRENQAQLKRLLDLYLAGDFDKDLLLERKKRLEDVVAKLEQERKRLMAQLEQNGLGDTGIEEIITFAHRLSQGLEEAEVSFEARRRIIELLDVHIVLTVEDGERVVYPSFILGEEQDQTRLTLTRCNRSLRA